MQTFTIKPFEMPSGAGALRTQVRDIISAHVTDGDIARRANCWQVNDPEFSRVLGKAGLIGMTWPKAYGGHERSALERYIVLEELLAAGAPVGAHWIADRQTAPLLLRYGTEEQRQRWVPGIAAGEVYGCIGLSEPNAGSDLASVRASARLDGDGWLLNGQKIWTTNAHIAHIMIGLFRSEDGSERNAGLSQFLIPLDTPGITIRPIINLTGEHDFNEVFFEDVRLPAEALVGVAGNGWAQATAELSLERSGPERYLSSMVLVTELVRHACSSGDPAAIALAGKFASEAWTLRQMSLAVAGRMAMGEDPALEATIVKDLGNSFEQAIPTLVQQLVELDLSSGDPLAVLTAQLLQLSPSFSLRGGTREILRGIVARGLGLR
ncbi:acyl-CoA dehydrogenase family protein [Sphingobium sp.]|uniref:acyl-CoA dehydrogenase family protein n=1 Tax=Sphingobium sp. TaxID=1912891 RepID=UPI002BB23317|nr:acyl-CoA dehydrogenase family protein [Sphingobium sp.]HUD93911.1 acyl-CoA dehydrogenase family protein [Sphingobium sp.]